MKKLSLPSGVTRAFHKVGFQLKKHSPEILVVAGVVGTVTGAVLACKATLKVNEVLDESKINIDKIHEATERGATAIGEEYTIEDSKKDLTLVYTQTGVKLAKLYGPAILVGTAGIIFTLAGNNILRKRNAALAAAYTVLDTGFKEYRGRVVDRFGKELDRELRYNIKAKEIEEVVVNEDGTEQTVKKTVEVADINDKSHYCICFDETCTGWTRNAEENKFFLLQQQSYANKLLKDRGHLFLNEVYDLLGAQRTAAGQEVGWVYDKEQPIGDNEVDFNIFDLHDESKRRFINGYEKSIWVDFNVDGPIRHLLP